MKLDPASLRSLYLAGLNSPARRSRWALVAGGAIVFALILALASPSTEGTRSDPTAGSLTPATSLDGSGSQFSLPAYQAEGGSLPLVAEPDWPAVLLDLGGKLLLTLALAYVSLYLLRKYVVRTTGQRQTSSIAIVETVPMGQHRSLHLVRVGNQHLLLGATPSQISLLAEVEDPSATTTAAPAGGAMSFQDHIRSFTGADIGAGQIPTV